MVVIIILRRATRSIKTYAAAAILHTESYSHNLALNVRVYDVYDPTFSHRAIFQILLEISQQ